MGETRQVPTDPQETVRRFPSSSGVEVVAYDWGGPGPDAPPLLFVHATGLHAHCYAPIAQRLRRSYRCFSVDLRGHGATDSPEDGNFGWNELAVDVEAAIDGFGLAKASDAGRLHGHGHSMGAAVAALVEAHRPGTFARLFLYEPILPFPQPNQPAPGANESVAGARRRRQVMASRRAAIENYGSKPPWNTVDAEALEAYVTYGFVDQPDGTVRLACSGDDEASTFENSNHDIFPRLDGVRCPVTIAYGRDSGDAMTLFSTTAAGYLPRARLLTLEDRTHFGPFEDIDGYADLVEKAFTDDPPPNDDETRRAAYERASGRSRPTAES